MGFLHKFLINISSLSENFNDKKLKKVLIGPGVGKILKRDSESVSRSFLTKSSSENLTNQKIIKREEKDEDIATVTLPFDQSFYFSPDAVKIENPNIAMLLNTSDIKMEEEEQELPNLESLTSLDLISLPPEEVDYLASLSAPEDWDSQSLGSGSSYSNSDYGPLKFEYDDILSDLNFKL